MIPEERPVYERMTDSELGYSLERSSNALEESVERYMASKLLEDTRENSGFDRIVLGLDGTELETADRYMEKAHAEYRKAIEEASSREKDFSEHIRDDEKIVENTASWIEELTFDRIGLSGIAKK